MKVTTNVSQKYHHTRGSPVELPKKNKSLPKATPKEQVVLFAINDRRVYGLEIKSIIDEATRGRQKITIGSLYPILQSLEEKGLINSEWGDETTCGARRRYHSVTALGKAVINDILATQQNLLHGEYGQM